MLKFILFNHYFTILCSVLFSTHLDETLNLIKMAIIKPIGAGRLNVCYN